MKQFAFSLFLILLLFPLLSKTSTAPSSSHDEQQKQNKDNVVQIEDPKHHCIHDTLPKETFQAIQVENYNENDEKRENEDENDHPNESHHDQHTHEHDDKICTENGCDDAKDLNVKRLKMMGNNRRATYTYMTVKMENYYLDRTNDATRSCSSAGITVKPDGSTDYTCTQDDVLTDEKIALVKSLATAVKEKLEKMLKVQSLGVQRILRTRSCGQSPVGINSTNDYYFAEDMVFWVSARPIIQSNVLGFASSCATGGSDSRPVMGYFNVNPSALSSGKFAFLKGLFLHECTHALGFSSANFGSSARVKTAPRVGVSGVSGFSSSNIVNIARNHYGCPTLDIVEIENNGGSGTAGSHFEKRTFINEIMVGSSSQLPQYSKFTLAVLEETGWYQADYTQADPFGFGYHKGCDFVMKACSKATWGSVYCSTNGDLSCTPDRSGPGSCVNSGGKGSDTLADECPYFLNIADTACPQSHSGSIYGDGYGETSRCFSSTLLQDSPVGLTRSARCYPTYCKSDRDLRVKVGAYWNSCPDGMTITVPGFGGKLECPNSIELCNGISVPTSAKYFPTYESIEPSSGATGQLVKITGSGFSSTGMMVIIGENCENIKVVSSTEITCNIPKVNFFSSIGQAFSGVRQFVIVQNKENGYSDVGEGAFEITISASDILAAFGVWAGENSTLTVCIFVSFAFFVFSAIFFGIKCLRKSRVQKNISEIVGENLQVREEERKRSNNNNY